MKFMAWTIGCSILLTLPIAAKADWIGSYSVSLVEVAENGVYFSAPSGTLFPNPHSCTNATYVVFETGTALVSRALAAGLAAQASGKPVRFNISGCFNSYIKAIGLEVSP
jgi:hypothetical protein